MEAALRGEYRRDTSTDQAMNRDNWLISGTSIWRLSEETRLMFGIDALVSRSDQTSLRDGRYIEANIGFAHRPVFSDRLNILAKYTYLEDLPGSDQVNVAGDIMGPRQRSHIFSLDTTYDLNTQWTIGGKLGYRTGEVETRGSGAFIKNNVGLGVVRADYNFVHNWDAMIEGRVMRLYQTNTTEKGMLAGVWRHVGSQVKVGVGYQWGSVSDDLRLIEGRSSGPFLNIIAKF